MKLYFVIVFLLLFMGENVVTKMGFSYNQYLMYFVAIALPLSLKQVKEITRIKTQFILLVYLIIYFCIRVFILGGEGAFWYSSLLIGAPLLYSIFPLYTNMNQLFYKKICFLVFGFFLTEVLIAIFEKIQGVAIFGWSHNDSVLLTLGSDSDFRSVALLGHPLQNALVVSILMSFILISSLKKKYRYFLWMLGFISILCFNTRPATNENYLKTNR